MPQDNVNAQVISPILFSSTESALASACVWAPIFLEDRSAHFSRLDVLKSDLRKCTCLCNQHVYLYRCLCLLTPLQRGRLIPNSRARHFASCAAAGWECKLTRTDDTKASHNFLHHCRCLAQPSHLNGNPRRLTCTPASKKGQIALLVSRKRKLCSHGT